MPTLNDSLVKFLGVLASIATIVGMCIGAVALVPAFGQWSNSREMISTPVVQSTNQISLLPTISTDTLFVTPTFTPMPPTPRLIEQTDTYSIIVRSPLVDEEPSGGLKLNIVVGGQMAFFKMALHSAGRDTEGKWIPADTGIISLDGLNFVSDLTPGMYALTGHNKTDVMLGNWGNYFTEVIDETRSHINYLIFPIEENLVTEVTLYFGIFELDVLFQDEQDMIASVHIWCEQKEVTGESTIVKCGYPHYRTSRDGQVQLITAPGEYFVEVEKETKFKIRFRMRIDSVDTTKFVVTAPSF